MKKIVTIVALFCMVAVSAVAQDKAAAKGTANKGAKKELKKDLHLSKAQAQQLKEVKKNTKAQAKQIKENESLSKKEKHQKLHDLKAAEQQKTKILLTPEQETKLAQWKQENKKKKAAKQTS